MTSRAYAWLATGGGTWSVASDWNDVTDGIDPSLTAPGPQDSVTVAGPSGASVQTIAGPGAAASGIFSGNTHLSGAYSFGTLTAGAAGAGGLLEIQAHDALSATALTLASGSLLTGGGTVSVAGTLAIGGPGGAAATLYATNGGSVRSAALFMAAASAAITVDPSASVEVGNAGGAAAGDLTVDAGALLAGQGGANAYGGVINDGAITAQGGTLMLGAVSGTGTLGIAAGATLVLNGRTGAGQSVDFAGALATLAIATEFDEPTGTITGFAAGDAIDMLGSPITAASYSATGNGDGVLTLTYGGQVADTLELAGNFTGDVFLPSSDGAGGTDITLAPAAVSTGGPSPGTGTPDAYAWTAAGAGAWNVAANWQDVTAGSGPAAIAPGAHDLVTITGGSSGFLVVAGPGNAASLSVTGALALSGAIDIGTLAVGAAGSVAGGSVPAALDLMPGAVMQAQTAAVPDGALDVSGQGASLGVAGTLVLGGGALGVGLPTASLSASEGAAVTLAGLVMGGGAGAFVTTDPASSIVIGAASGTPGAVSIAAGATLTGNGIVNPFADVIDNGLVDAAGPGATLTLGNASGSGSLLIEAGASLDLLSPTALPIGFAAQSGSLVPTLDLGSELALPTGVLSGVIPGDVIDVLGDPISSVALTRSTSSPSTLTLFYGSTAIGHLLLAGGFAHQAFFAVPDATDGTDLVLVQQAGGVGGGGGDGTDTLSWSVPQSGAWSNAGNWTDLTTGGPAAAGPGASNPVIVDGPPGSSFQGLNGPGTCSSLVLSGNSLLNGTFATGPLTIGTDIAGTVSAASLELLNGDLLTASSAILTAGTLVVSGQNTAADIAGTLSVGGAGQAASVTVAANAAVQAGSLVMQTAAGEASADATIGVDATSRLEVGSLGGAAAGALTVDPGDAVSGAGTLDVEGAIVDNGSIEAAGGTLAVGAFSGTGTLDIGTEATLTLEATDPGASACQILFQGGGATLDLAADFAGGTAPLPAIIAGFAPGDAILSSSAPVSAVAFTQGAGLGTLTLSYAGQSAATLLLAGNYSTDVFSLEPDGAGSEITVAPASGGGSLSPGTPTPDLYVWTGSAGATWNDAANWNDSSASQTPALIAPGLNDLVTISSAAGSGFTYIAGPADAAELTLLGNVALAGTFAFGGLAIDGGVLALAAGASVAAYSADAAGGIEVQDAACSVAGTLALEAPAQQAGAGSILVADGQASVAAGALVMSPGSAVLADATSNLTVGGQAGNAGAVTIDPGGRVSGAGALDILGDVVDNGSVIAAGGTLGIGAVSGAGTLLIGQGAELALDGAAGSGLIIDFAANGTLSATVTPVAAIEGFGTSDAILLPFPDAITASYAPTAPGAGELTISGESQDGELQVLGVLTLLGMNAGSQFSVTGSAGGGTLLTTMPAQNGTGGGGPTMSGSTTAGGVVWDTDQFIASQPAYTQQALNEALAGLTSYVFTSPDGSFDGAYPEFGYANVAIVGDAQPYSAAWIPYGYRVLIADGDNPVSLVDSSTGDDLLIGNAGNDSITGLGQNDTMIGGVGGNTAFWAVGSATMIGGGSDVFVSGNGNVSVSTSAGNRSSVWLGPADNSVVLNGSDTVACTGSSDIGNDTVTAQGDAGTGCEIVGPDVGEMFVHEGAGNASVVGHAGSMVAYGGSGSSLIVGTTGYLEYFGGTGGACVVGESGYMYIEGGAGAITVFGGTGEGEYSAQAGNSYFVVGEGPSTVTASSGNVVWLEGAANVSTSVNGGGVIAWGANSSGNNIFQAGSGPSSLVGGYGNDQFMAGTGNATLEGGSGAETFNFTDGLAGGGDLILNFAPGRDVIALHGYSESAAAILAGATVKNGSTMFSLDDGTHITVSGVTGLTSSAFSSS